MKTMKRLIPILVCFCLLISGNGWAEKGQAAATEARRAAVTAEAPDGEASIVFTEDESCATEINDPGVPQKTAKPEQLKVKHPGLQRKQTGGASPTGGTGAKMTILELKAKYPPGKFWNHSTNPGGEEERNNADGWTEHPCPTHEKDDGYYKSGIFTCNDFSSGYQCHGYALKLGYDATGSDPDGWELIRNADNALNNLKAGDIIRYLNEQHTIYVIAVNEEQIMYTDCNTGLTCVIHWGSITTKSEIRKTFSYLLRSPVEIPWGGDGACWCNAKKAGLYTANQDIDIRSGHGYEYSAVATIPAGMTVQVLKGGAGWMHVTCGGYSGYVPEWALDEGTEDISMWIAWSTYNLTVPNDNPSEIRVNCFGDLPEGFILRTDYPEDPEGFFSIELKEWEGTDAIFRITGLAPGATTICFQVLDPETEAVLAARDLNLFVTVDKATLAASKESIKTGMSSEGATFKLTGGGYIPGPYTFRLWATSGDCFQVDFPGEWSGSTHQVRIKGTGTGSGRAVFALVCEDEVLVSKEVSITVTDDRKATLTPSEDEVSLNLKDGKDAKIWLTASGKLPEWYKILAPEIQGDNCCSTEWSGNWDGTRHAVLIHPLKTGTATLTFWLAEDKTEKKVAKAVVTVRVTKEKEDTYKLNTKTKTAEFTAPADRNATTLTIKDTVKADGVTYKVTGIAESACQGMKKLKTLTIGKNVKKIGEKAFSNCTALKTITIKSENLKEGSIGIKAFKGVTAKATVKIPKKVFKSYKTMLIEAGISKKATFKKN